MTRIPRQLPCRCGYDLRGRFVGDACPECGWVIDAPGPRWCTAECLHRLARMSTLARIPCLLLLVVPAMFVVLLTASRGDNESGWPLTVLAFVILMPLQIVTQAVAVWRMAVPEFGATRVRTLRIATVARTVAFGSAVALIIWDSVSAAARTGGFDELYIAAYLLVPLLAIGSDFVTLGVLGSLRRESAALVSGWNAVMPPFARWTLIGVYPIILVPFVGWFFGPILWTIALSIGFAQVGAVAEVCRKQLP